MTVRDIEAALTRTLHWQLGLRDGEGRIICPEHRIEHTGKSACTAILAAVLAGRPGCAEADALYAAAVQQGERLVVNLVREGTSPCHTFRPGRHDPYNCSNSVIDGGAASDALATLARTMGDRLSAEQRERFVNASALHAGTYLRYAVLDKGVPAQRAWGLTGLAAAQRVQPNAEWDAAGLAAVEILAGIQNGDGSYPYHPVEWGAGHPGASDVSAFYQSRVTAFLFHALDDLDRVATEEPFASQLERGLDFLLGLQGPDGRKVGLVEAKPWYWGATYEVASHPFDVAALASGWRHFGRPEFGHAALAAARAWVDHLDENGRPQSHAPGPGRGQSYQCPTFWAGHACWMARALESLDAFEATLSDRDEGGHAGIAPQLKHFADADLVRLEDARVVAWVRGARPGANVHHGSPHGAGLVRAIRRDDHVDLVARCRLGGSQLAEWSGKSGRASWSRGWRAGGHEVRFSLWQARVHWRARARMRALVTPAAVFRRGVLAFGHPRVGSAFALDPQLECEGLRARLTSTLAHRSGAPVAGSRLVREFEVDGEGLLVRDRLVDPGEARDVQYRVPGVASEVVSEPGEFRYRLA